MVMTNIVPRGSLIEWFRKSLIVGLALALSLTFTGCESGGSGSGTKGGGNDGKQV
jgi:hypothetical protein